MKKTDGGTGILKKPSSQRLIPGTLGSTGVSNTKGNVNFAANSSGFSETAIRQKPTRLAPLKPALTSADASQTLGRAGSPKTLSKSSAKTIQSAAPELLGRLAEYRGEEDAIPCRRFPHKKFCGCDLKCYEVETNPKFKATLVSSGIYVGSIESAFHIKELLSLGITHVLDVSCMQYTKREHYFKYYSLAVYDNHDVT